MALEFSALDISSLLGVGVDDDVPDVPPVFDDELPEVPFTVGLNGVASGIFRCDVVSIGVADTLLVGIL